MLAPALAFPSSAAVGDPVLSPYVTRDPGSWPASVAVGDVTGDGRPDALLTTQYYFDAANDYRLWVYAQQADGSLSSTPAQSLPTSGTYGSAMSVATADVDEDGDLDVAVTTDQGVDLFEQGTGGLTPTWTVPIADAQDVEMADVSGDGLADLVVSSANGIDVWWQVNGDFMPSPAGGARISSTPPTEVEVADVTGDGRNDVVAAVDHRIQVLAQAADHSFGAPQTYDTGYTDNVKGIAVGDIDGDGRNDVAATSGGNRPGSRVVTLRQTPNGVLAAPVTLASYDIPEPVEIADVTGDGRQDVVVVHGGWNEIGVYTQHSDGTLGAEALYSAPYASHYETKGLALGDVSGDGLRDVLVGDYNNGLVELRSAGTLTPLDTTITAGPSGSVRSTSASFSFTSSVGGATFQCSMDSTTWTACTSPATYSGLATGGSHTFRVRALADGDVDGTPAERTFSVEPAADLATTLAQSATTAKKGTTVTYSATVTNRGPQGATSPSALVTLPSGLKLVSATGGSCSAGSAVGTVRCTFADLAASGSATAVVKATVTTTKGTLVVTAAGSSTTWDPVGANDSVSVTTKVGAR